MHHLDKFVQQNIPKNLQHHAYEVAEELWSLLEVLDKKGYVRPILRGTEKDAYRKDFLEIMKDLDKILSAFNKFFDIYMNEDKRKRFFELLKEKKFGFSDEDLMYLLHSLLVFIFLAVTEMFKNSMVFMLKGIKPTKPLGALFGRNGELVRITRETGEGKAIGKKIDIDLRNALAHFMFRKLGKKTYYYDFKKENKEWIFGRREIDYGSLFQTILKHNTLNKLMVEIIPEWYGL